MTTPHALDGVTVEIYDTTLRDGAQQEGMNLTVADKIAIAPLLDELGVAVIEGGWPGAIPKDTEFFGRLEKEVDLPRALVRPARPARVPTRTSRCEHCWTPKLRSSRSWPRAISAMSSARCARARRRTSP